MTLKLVWVSIGVDLGAISQVSKGFIGICIVPLEVLTNSCFGLFYILVFAAYAGNGINQIRTLHVKFLLQPYMVPVTVQVIFSLWSRLG